MKKLALLFVAVLAVGVSSCSKDDDSSGASFEGKWVYSKEGIAAAGQEVLNDYEHAAGCTKDYMMVSATTVVDHEFFGEECTEDTYSQNYVRNGNTLTITEGGETFTATISQLTDSTLKIKSTFSEDGQSIDYITVYTRG